MKLTVKLPVVVVGAILLTAAASGAVSVVIGRYVLRQAALDDSVHRLEAYSSAIVLYVESARSLLTTTAGSPNLSTLAAPREVAARVLAHSDVFEYLMFITPQGIVTMLEPRALEARLSHRDLSFNAWFGEVRRANRTIVSDLHISPATQRPTIVVAAPVRAADGRTIGSWAGALKLGELSEIGAIASDRSGPIGWGYVTDRRGLVIAHQARRSYVENQTDFSTLPSVSAALAGQTGSGEYFNSIENELKLTAYRPLRNLGWAVVYGVPTSVALAPVDALTRGILSASIALAALIGVAMFVLARRTVAPLSRLTAAANIVGTGDLNFRTGLSGDDEIGELSRAFDRMVSHIQKSRAENEYKTVQLEAANKELEAFSYSASHDLRAPLQTIAGFSRALEEDYSDKLDAEAKDYLQRVRVASQHMARLVDDLLKLSRLTRADMLLEPVDLGEIARSVADALHAQDPAREVTFDIATGATVQGDKRLLAVLMENLLGNAWKYTSKHPCARIEFGVREREGERVYYVRDDGAGFDMAHAEKLFVPFQRLHAASDFAGNGVGLATVRRIVVRHDGRVWGEAAPEKGATFYFTIPGMHTGTPDSV